MVDYRDRGDTAGADTVHLFNSEFLISGSIVIGRDIEFKGKPVYQPFRTLYMAGGAATDRDDVFSPRLQVKLRVECGGAEETTCGNVELS